MKTDELEPGTGDNPNPADEVPFIPRKDDWQGRLLDSRTRQLEGESWYPRAVAAPATEVPQRFHAFTVDKGDFQAAISPQKWDCTAAIAVPVNDGAHGNPIEVVPFLPGRASVTITNLGANPVIISPTISQALNGIGVTVAANGGTFKMDSQAAAWAWATGGASSVQAMWTAYEAPTSHLPPKDAQ